MRGGNPMRCAVALLLAAAATFSALAAPAPAGEPDVKALLRQAGAAFDLDAEDAVFLLESLREDWTADGRRVHSVHRIVFIRTGLAIRRLADLRVPYDHERQSFSVTTLRTWRPSDERWTESGPTAVVETLPFALERAPDYGGRREMMLLHDGVELPCVLETAYTIEDKESFRAGADGLWAFPRFGPTLRSRFVLGFSPGEEPRWAVAEGAPEPLRGRDEAAEMETLSFEMGPIEPAAHPPTPGPSGAGPRVAWSTWRSWDELGTALRERFDAAARTDEELDARLAEKLEAARTEFEKASLIAEFVAETTRAVEYDTGWWPAPREAARTWSTAYGSAPDRAVLAAALFLQAGLRADLAFRGSGPGEVDRRVPGLSWADGPELYVSGPAFEGWFDPVSAAWSRGRASRLGYPVWRLGRDPEPVVEKVHRMTEGIAIRLDLSHSAEEGRWSGTGVLTASGALCPFGQMTGLANEALGYLGRAVGDVLPGAEIGGFNPEVFSPSRVTVGFTVDLPEGERDGLGRLRLEAGAPQAVATLLERAAVHLHEEARGSAVRLPAAFETRLELHLDPGELDTVYLPQPLTIENDAGSFELEASAGEDGIELIRTLGLARDRYEAKDWPLLRALLLAEGAEGNRLLLLE